MTVARSVSDVLSEHTVFAVECIDRMFLNVYVPGLQYAAGLVGYVHRQLGLPIASTAPLARITDAFGAAVHRFARTNGIPWVDFAKGQRKDDVMHEHLQRFTAKEGVVFIGRAQEKTKLFRTEKRRDAHGDSYPWIVKTTGLVNHFYFYCYDDDFGPFFLKFCSYFPYNAKLCINGNHWAQRQAAKAGIEFTPLDNGFAAVDDVDRLQQICDDLGPAQIDALLRKWLAILPHPFTAADRAAGYRYELSILQAEFSLTQMLDKPASGRMFFEQVIRDNLDIGRPDQVALVFDRRLMRRRKRPTPGPFRTRVITEGVTPSLYVDYKHTRIKQYHKQGRALRTETTINDTTRLFDRQTADQSARATRDRLLRQPASTARPTTRPRPDHRHRRPARHHRPGHHRHRRARARPAAGRPAQPRPALGPASVPLPAQRIRQQGPARAHRRPARTRPRRPHRRADHLRPAPAQTPRPDHPHPAAPTATRSPTTAWTPRNSSPPSTTASCPPAWPNSPPPTTLRAASKPRPPPTATRSIPSPPQHNSPHDPNPNSSNTNLTQDSGFAGSSLT